MSSMNAKHIITPTFLFAILVICSFAPLLLINEPEVLAASYPTIYVTPSVAYGEPNQTVTVSLMIANVFNLWSYQVYVNYAPDILEIVRNSSVPSETSVYAYLVHQGDFMKRGAYDTFWQPKVNNTGGQLKVWESMLLPSPDTSGSGELFSVVFKIKKTGASILNLTETYLETRFSVSLPHEDYNGAITTVSLGMSPSLIRGEDYPADSFFDVNVSLGGTVENFYGFDLNITYGKDTINVTSVAFLPLLEMPNDNLTEINYTEGRIRLLMNCTAPASPISTTGPIATLRFKVLPSEQKADIEIVDSILVDSSGNEIIHLVSKATFTGGLIRNIGIREATLSSYAVNAGDGITLTITAYNNGTRNETFTVIAYAVNNITVLAGGPEEFTIESNQTSTLTLTLGTYGLGGNYTIYVNMPSVPDESTTGDNQYAVASMLSVTPKAEPVESPFGTTFYLAIAIIIIVIVVVLIYYLRRRR